MLIELKGIDHEISSVLWLEGLSRKFDNRRQLAAYAGLAASHWQSGNINNDQGVSKAGDPRLRTTLVQLAWLWVRHQLESTPSRWFIARATEAVIRHAIVTFGRDRQRARCAGEAGA